MIFWYAYNYISFTTYQYFTRFHIVVRIISWVKKPGMEPDNTTPHPIFTLYIKGLKKISFS